MTPTIRADYRTRVVAVATVDEAKAEAAEWRRDGYRTRIIVNAKKLPNR